MVADGLSIINADFSSTSFRVSRVSIGRDNFLGNHIAYPAQGRTGDNCLLATKVMVPIDGEVREGVGPAGLAQLRDPAVGRARQQVRRCGPATSCAAASRAKNRHNAVTIGAVPAGAVGPLVRRSRCSAWSRSTSTRRCGASAVALATVAGLLFTVAYFVLVERAVDGFRPLRAAGLLDLRPRTSGGTSATGSCRRHATSRLFNGTPFKSVIWRLLGVRIGRRVFDDGCCLTGADLVTPSATTARSTPAA